ncbi:helix-turn-helix transcriptional regulator [Nocardioides carbamazepini]|jgi:y4mF family transcriptional regulator|uniref:helix-turn-helix transcriptional regulator n=1 Tax=Nocardioides carbamazepini TaxID=2854259 RepID=UPI002149B655|nr:helix-turn-helix transcriptional regulator [Nocardioides carbamazepini]MCR1785066.1 helix-turn-helix transcriptional regulator [Nocardioides carbamazepini]
MSVTTVRDLGARVRSARTAQGLTQADLAAAVGVGRDWVVRLEKGHPRLEVQKVLDALVVLGLTLEVEASRTAAKKPATRAGAEAKQATKAQRTAKERSRDQAARAARPAQTASVAGEPDPADASDPFETLFGRRH